MKRAVFVAMLVLIGMVYAVDADFYITKVEHTKLKQDSYGVVNITLKNLAPNYAVYTSVSFDPQDTSPIDPVDAPRKYIGKFLEGKQSEQYFGAILQREEANVSYRVYVKKGTPPGVYFVPLLIQWRDEYLNPKSQTVILALPVEGEIKLSISGVATSPARVRSGQDDVAVYVSISNTGDAEARNVRVKLLPEAPFSESFSGSGESFLGNIPPYGSGKAEFHIDVAEKAKPGKYTIPLEISYQNSKGEKFSIRDSLEILVEPRPYFEVEDVKITPETPAQGDRVVVHVKIKNVGYEKAENVDVRVIRESSQPFEFNTRSDFVGTLKPKEVGEAALDISVKKDALPKEYRLRLSIRCTGDSDRSDDNVYTQEVAVPLRVVENKTPEKKGWGYLGIVVVTIAGIAYLVAVKLRKA